MAEIVIRITVPDGVNVRVDQGKASSGSSKPFTPRPDPDYPEHDPVCPVHEVDWKLVPAGVSKKAVNPDGTPKRYNAFWACPERGCTEKPSFDSDAPMRMNHDDALPF